MNKYIPVWILALVVFAGINFTVLFGGAVKHVLEGGDQLGKIGPAVATIASFPSLVKEAFYEVGLLTYKPDDKKTGTITRPPQLIKNRFPEIDGFRKNGVMQEGAVHDDGYLLWSAYDLEKGQSTVKLMRIKDQQVLHEWVPDIRELAALHDRKKFNHNPGEIRPTRFRIWHPLLYGDGSLVFHGDGPLFRIDACSSIEWVIDQHFHHAIEAEPNGDFWVGTHFETPTYKNEYFIGYNDEGIAKVSPDGEVLFSKSISGILEENGYRGLLFGVGPYKPMLIHMNDIQPAHYSTDYWQQGDLLISVRNRSTVFLYRPGTNKVLWLQTGPWLHQHDPNFVGQSRISVFGNDSKKRIDDRENGEKIPPGGQNNIYVFDFADGKITTPYTKVMKEADVRTVYEGRSKILENGDAFIEESEEGRLLRISTDQVVWEAVSRVDNSTLVVGAWSRYLTEEQVKSIMPALENAECS
jgi:hypothetical protein